jgi:hypothetical protein
MLSLEKCRDILKQNEGSYSTEQVRLLREFLHSLATFGIEEVKRQNKLDESNNIHTGIDRRTGGEGV